MSTALGVVPERGLDELCRVVLHGEVLPVHARRTLSVADVAVLAESTPWPQVQQQVRAAQRPLVVHDLAYPLTPAGFVREAVRVATASGAVVVGVRPVTDTIKVSRSGLLGETVDRDSLWAVCAPVVLPCHVVDDLAKWPRLDDPAALVGRLRERYEVDFLEAPVGGFRVEDEGTARMLEVIAPVDSTPGR